MTMPLSEIANTLVEYCRTQQEAKGLDELYAPGAVSVEAADMPGTPGRETHGVDGIRGKHAWWAENFIVHDASVDGPYLHGDDRFGVIFEMDVEAKANGDRSRMKEIGVYHVADGKIVREEFFYTM